MNYELRVGGAHIKRWLARVAAGLRTPVRIRHYRGRKVHSPFVYSIVRNVIMKTSPEGEERALFDALRSRGFSARRAAQLQNLYTFQGYGSVVFAEGEGGEERTPVALDGVTLCLVMPSLQEGAARAVVQRARGTGAVLCLAWPYENRHRRRFMRDLVASHSHTSIDGRGFLLLFTDERLPKQHFKL